MLTLSILEPVSAISVATLASTPRWLATVTRIATSNSLSVSGAQSTSSHFSGSPRDLAAVGQSLVCTTSPWPFLMKPRMGSPGMGLQHLANCTANPSDPWMTIEPAGPFPSVWDSARLSSFLATIAASRLPMPMSAATSWRDFAPRSRASLCQRSGVASEDFAPSARTAWMSMRSQIRHFLKTMQYEEVPDLRARLGGLHVGQPRRVGMLVSGGDDLDPVAVLELSPERHELVVDPRRGAAVADVGVHRVGEIHRGRAARHRHDLALGSEHVDFVRKEVDLDVLQEFGGIARGVLDVEQRLQPLVGALLHFVDLRVGALVQPVRSDAGVGDAVHGLRADLDFDRHAVRADQRGVQRLIAVDLRDRDVVLEFSGDRLVQAVQGAEREVAGGNVLDDDPKTVDVEHLRERQVLLVHLVVDRIDVLLAAGDGGVDLSRLQALSQRLEDLVDDFTAIAARRLHRLGEHLVTPRVEV